MERLETQANTRSSKETQSANGYDSVADLPNFPFKSIEEVHALVREKKINFRIWTDVDLISQFGSEYSKRLKKTVTGIQYAIVWVGILLPVILAFTSGDFWFLTAIPIAFVGTATTSPTSFRHLFMLGAVALFVASFFIENEVLRVAALFFSISNLTINVLRMVNEGTILNIIYKNEEAFIWGYLNKVFTIIVNKTGEAVMPELLDLQQKVGDKLKSNNSASSLIPYRKGKKWGYATTDRKIVLECIYDRACPFFEGIASVRINDKWGCINDTGKQIVDCKYEEIIHYYGIQGIRFFNELAVVKLNDKYGFIDKRGNQIIPCIYDNVTTHWQKFSEGFAVVKLNNKWGFIDMAGKSVIPCNYEWADNFYEGLAPVRMKGKYGFIDKNGNTVVPFIYDEAERFVDGLALVKINDKESEYGDAKYGYINTKGKQVIPVVYDHGIEIAEGLASVSLNNKYGFIDKNGKQVIPCVYDDGWRFSEGLARVGKRRSADFMDFQYGYIDKAGKMIVPYTYIFADNFSEGLATIEVDKKYGFIDKKGTVVIPCIYDDIGWKFSGGVARVAIVRNGRWEGGYIDTKGREYRED